MSLTPTLAEVALAAGAVTPTPRQLAWQELEFNAFFHFGVNTFTDREWGDGTEPEAVFNPTALDAGQWAQACRDAGIRMLILTAKHHDGFCLWPSRYTEHSVKNSPWRGGKGDVVREVSDACRAAGLKFGVYLSPWDRNSRLYGTPEYNTYFKNQLTELLTQYGEIGEVWFDGACGEGPNGKRQVYDWAGYIALVRELQPDAVIGPCGPDVRWVGNEEGLARDTEWSVIGTAHDLERPAFEDWNEVFYHHMLSGTRHASQPGDLESLAGAPRLAWWPSEVDVSIRPGWFYHASEDLRVHSLERLVDIYYRSVGRNNVLLLNLPPDRRGLIHEHDVARLAELRRTLDATFRDHLARHATVTASSELPGHAATHVLDGDPATYWQAEGHAAQPFLEFDLGQPVTFNRARLEEMVTSGQRVASYVLEAWHDGVWKEFCRGATAGRKRLDRFGEVTAQRVRLRISESRGAPALRAFGLYRAALGG
jgi:alpha-L-fucosidase